MFIAKLNNFLIEGDIEGMEYVYAFQQFGFVNKKEDFCRVHVSLVPQLKTSGEYKTKPTQRSVAELRKYGLEPDLLICRSETVFGDDVKSKISDSCIIKLENVICLPDLPSIYKVPFVLEEQQVVSFLNSRLQLNIVKPDNFLSRWTLLVSKMDACLNNVVQIALVGKYTKLKDSYASLIKAVQHACIELEFTPVINYVDSSDLEMFTKKSQPVRYHEAWQKLHKSKLVQLLFS